MYKLLVALAMVMPAVVSAEVKVHDHEAHPRVDITVDGKPFTSYIWPTSLKKPVLYPLVLSDGVTVTRGFPLEPRAGERQDHPHHAGLWFNYGNVNGFDFWNNSDAITGDRVPHMGTIRQDKIVSAHSGKDAGELVTESTWIAASGTPLLRETTTFVFKQVGDVRTIDRVTKLTALEKVVFNDDKEGVLGIRVARWLESANEKGGVFVDASGKETKVEGATGAGATGVYLSSEGKQGDDVWSSRGRWCVLNGHDPEGHTAAIAILDHPGNPGYPTYWHARGYGLFAANPLGAHIFDPKATPMNYTVEKGQTTVFKYRVLLSTKTMTAAQVNAAADAFAKADK
ncbi:MAG: PmoA family protein [Terriglobus sp.]